MPTASVRAWLGLSLQSEGTLNTGHAELLLIDFASDILLFHKALQGSKRPHSVSLPLSLQRLYLVVISGYVSAYLCSSQVPAWQGGSRSQLRVHLSLLITSVLSSAGIWLQYKVLCQACQHELAWGFRGAKSQPAGQLLFRAPTPK